MLSATAATSVERTPPLENAISPELLERPGAALRAAREALDRRDFRLAEKLLEAIADRHLLIADHADLLRMRARVESGRTDAALAMR
ncbi:MAG: hypothetical protein JRD03_10790, partial [Deltaproteobacteria bacterium]|nr:hypothetical protein [Deltaproteobacteria bacterium]